MYVIALFPGDSALLLFLLVAGAFVGLGVLTDGLRMAMLTVAAGISLLASQYLGGFVPDSLLPTNPVWRSFGLDAALAYPALLAVLFLVIHKLHEMASIEIKYKLEPRKHADWRRVNSVIGLCLGGILGILHFLYIAGKVTPIGYATAQMPAADPAHDPVGYRLAGRLYKDFNSLGIDHAARPFDPMPGEYYAAVDVAALVYNNFGTQNASHILQFRGRLLSYPGLIDAAYQNANVVHLGRVHPGNKFLEALITRRGLSTVLADPTLKAAARDQQLRTQLAQVDLNDLRQYLHKGESPQYNSVALAQQRRPRILGRWVMDVDNTVEQFERAYPLATDPRTKRNIRQYLTAIAEQMSLSFSDGFYYLESKYFHPKALAREVNEFIPRTPNKPIAEIQSAPPQLQLFGQWAKDRNSSGFRTTFQFRDANRQVVEETPVHIMMYSTQMILTLEKFPGEKYVFVRD